MTDRARAAMAIAAARVDTIIVTDKARAVTIAAVRAAIITVGVRADRVRAVTVTATVRADIITARAVREAMVTAAVRADIITARAVREVMVIAAVRAADTITVAVRVDRARAAMAIVAARAVDTITVAVRVRAVDSQEDLPLEQMVHVAVRTDRDGRQAAILQIHRSRMLKSIEMKKREESVRRKTNVPEKIWFMKRMNPRCPEVSALEDLSDLRSKRWKSLLNRSK